MKPSVLAESAFGDDHHAAIDAQVRVLVEDMSGEEIECEYPSEDTDDTERAPDNVRDAAFEARYWMDGTEKISPSENWKPLVQKKH